MATWANLRQSPPDPCSLRQRVGAGVLDATGGCPSDGAHCDCQSPCGDPTGSLRAPGRQALPQAVSPPEGTAAASSRTLGTSHLKLRKRHSTQTPIPLFLTPCSHAKHCGTPPHEHRTTRA